MAAGRDATSRHSADTYFNYWSAELPKDVSLSEKALKTLYHDGFLLQQHNEALKGEIARNRGNLAEAHGLLRGQQEHIEDLGQQLEEIVGRPMVTRSRYLKSILIALFAGLAIASISSLVDGQSTAGSTIQAYEAPSLGGATVSPTPVSQVPSIALALESLPCEDGTFVDRLDFFDADSDAALVNSKFSELKSRAQAFKVVDTAVHVSSLSDSCPSVHSDIRRDGLIIWAGPFSSKEAAEAHCEALGYRTDINWDCYPRKAS